MLEVSFSSMPFFVTVTLYPDYGEEFNKKDNFFFHLKKGKKRICFFPKPAKRMRIRSIIAKDDFNEINIRLVKLKKAIGLFKKSCRVGMLTLMNGIMQ